MISCFSGGIYVLQMYLSITLTITIMNTFKTINMINQHELYTTLHNLPTEIKTEIISNIPQNEWHILYRLDVFREALVQHCLWRNVNFDLHHTIPDEFIGLVDHIVAHVHSYIWNLALCHDANILLNQLPRFINLVHLDLSDNRHVNSIDFLRYFNNIEIFELRNCDTVLVEEFVTCLPICSKLKHLDVEGCSQLDEGVFLDVLPKI